MKKGFRITALVLVCALLLSVVSVYAIPELRVKLFVELYHEEFEEGYADGQGVPAEDAVLLGYKALNEWGGEHPMMELVIGVFGGTYYGCYYSPDDVPLAFQNTEAELAEVGDDHWIWTAEGDNHGETSRMMARWYYFEATF